MIQQERHSEHCPDCKARVRELLERIYGECVANHRFDWPTHLSSYAGTQIYSTLRELAAILEKYRGFALKDFVKTETLAACDFWVPDPGFILEFDERQHFTTPRKLALSAYPDDLALGFSKSSGSHTVNATMQRTTIPHFVTNNGHGMTHCGISCQRSRVFSRQLDCTPAIWSGARSTRTATSTSSDSPLLSAFTVQRRSP